MFVKLVHQLSKIVWKMHSQFKSWIVMAYGSMYPEPFRFWGARMTRTYANECRSESRAVLL